VVALKFNQLGSVPAEIVGVGMPVAVTVNVPCVPAVKVVLLPLVKDGATGSGMTVRVKVWGTLETEFVAVNVMLYGELAELPVGGVPLRTPVVALKFSQLGSVPAEIVGAGVPEAATVNVPCLVSVKVVLFALVNAGATRP
jgi:hypothetical protein